MTNEFKIERGKSLVRSKGAGRPYKYPVNLLEVGQSFTVPIKLANNAKSAASREGRLHDKKFEYGPDANKKGLFRVERVA